MWVVNALWSVAWCAFHANFSYQAGSWTKQRRVITKVEWHPGELYPRVGFIVTNLTRPAERVVAFYNTRYLRAAGIGATPV